MSDQVREYAIAGSYAEFWRWCRTREGGSRGVHYLTKDRAESYLRWGMPKGTLHRIGTRETSPATDAAEELEISRDGARPPTEE